MARRNYLKDIEPDNKKQRPASCREYMQAFWGFLQKPKTKFDFKDRSRFIILLILVIILLQKVVEYLSN